MEEESALRSEASALEALAEAKALRAQSEDTLADFRAIVDAIR